MSKKEKKARLSGTELKYIADSSDFTGELTRIGLSGVRNYIRAARHSITNVRDVTSWDDSDFDEEVIFIEMQRVLSSSEEVGSDIGLLENTLIRFIHAGRDTRLISPVEYSGIDRDAWRRPEPEAAPAPTPDNLEGEDE